MADDPSLDELRLNGSRGTALDLDPDGFTMRYPFGRSRFAWKNIVGDFRVGAASAS
jgi:hypothetical protein